jgi:hypothetical protein
MTRLGKNILIDVLSYIGFVLLLGTGLILEYILPHGSGSLAARGTGRGAGERLVTTLWGMTREEWGEVHFWIAAATLVVLSLHLVLHWKWIVCVLSGKERPAGVSGQRALLGLSALLGTVALLVLPFLTPTEEATRDQLRQQETQTPSASEAPMDSDRPSSETEDISGVMTLQELQEETGVPYQYVLEKLGIPRDISPYERLGRLRRTYGFAIADVREIVEAYKK